MRECKLRRHFWLPFGRVDGDRRGRGLGPFLGPAPALARGLDPVLVRGLDIDLSLVRAREAKIKISRTSFFLNYTYKF
jgi:hypothetical protein